MRLHREIRRSAKRALAGAFGKSIAVMFIIALIMALFIQFESMVYRIFALIGVESRVLCAFALGRVRIEVTALSLIVTGMGTLFALLLLTPLLFGMLRWYARLAEGEAEDVTGVFRYFSGWRQLARCWGLALLQTALALLWPVVFLTPGAVTLALSLDLSGGALDSLDQVASMFGVMVGLALLVVGALCASVFLLRYCLAPYLFAQTPQKGVFACLRGSVRAMKGAKARVWLFRLGFIPWLILCALALPILFVVPYAFMANALYAKYLIERDARARPQGDGHPAEAHPLRAAPDSGGVSNGA